MSAAAQRKPPLILVSEDYDPDVWRSLEEEESAFESWAAVAQDIWGRGCFLPGQQQAVREGANGLTIDKSLTIGAVGCAVGAVGSVATDHSTYIEVFEGDGALLAHLQEAPGAANKFLKRAAWDPARSEFRAERYHGLMALRAFSAASDAAALVTALVAAVKPGGRLFVDDLFAADPSVAALVAQGIAGPGQKLTLHPQASVMEALDAAALEPRAKVVANEQLMTAIRAGLSHAALIAQRLKEIPQPFRKQRMGAFADELQRAAVLHQAVEKGLVTAMRTIHYKTKF